MNKLEFNCITKVLKKISTIDDDAENTYVYLDKVFDYHLPIIAKYGAIVETKPIN